MLVGYFSTLLFGWSWGGHHEITSVALTAALSALTASGKMKAMGLSLSQLRRDLAGLWLLDCCQDISVGNAVGLCGIEWPGGQVAHFMRESKESPRHAYDRCRAHIRGAALSSYRNFREALPKPKHSGFLGAIVDAVEAPVHFIENVYHFGQGERYLAQALHTFQDAYSPAHVLRDLHGQVIKDIYTWDDANKNPRPKDGWPGHSTYDNMHYNHLTAIESSNAGNASRDIIESVIGLAHESESVFTHQLDALLNKYLAKTF